MSLSDGIWPITVAVPGQTHYVFFFHVGQVAIDVEVNDEENKVRQTVGFDMS